ncbi:hypothetical protein [Rufibacter latericius]|uniref:Uncharacterized protein n=1 Tax=Rufibacter latericius TaxID=2487040 RepID=A0A3M9MN26_9BACT|nr:hypothetical protein [Rufibacter latericius]RNI26587.1 hypothetical protein EFB08_11250 [Rufibacter latericius]
MAKKKAGDIAPIINGSGNSIANNYTYQTTPPEYPWNNDRIYVLENIITSQEQDIKDLEAQLAYKEEQLAYKESLLENERLKVKTMRQTAARCKCFRGGIC